MTRPVRAVLALLASCAAALALTAAPASAVVPEDPFAFIGPVGSVTVPPEPPPVPDVRITRHGAPDFRPGSLEVRPLPAGQLCTPVRASLTITNRSAVRQVVTDGRDVVVRVPAGQTRSVCVGPDEPVLEWSLRANPAASLTVSVVTDDVDEPGVDPAGQELVSITPDAEVGFDPPLVQVRSTPAGVDCTLDNAGLLLSNDTGITQELTRSGAVVATLQPGQVQPLCFAPPGGLGSVASATFGLTSDDTAQLFVLVF